MRLRRLWNWTDAPLNSKPNKDLSGAFVMIFRYPLYSRVFHKSRQSPVLIRWSTRSTHRSIRHQNDAMSITNIFQVKLSIPRVRLNLINYWLYATIFDQSIYLKSIHI